MTASLILKPYERRRSPGLLVRLIIVAGLLFVAAFYGLMCAILPMQLVVVPLVPILLITALILWMMPDSGGVQEDLIAKAMVWFIALNILWPSYVALNAPGLPWITPTRIVVLTLVSVAVWNYATSADLRDRIREGLNGAPIVRKLFWLFWGVTTFSILLSSEPFQSLNKYANNQVYWTLMFALAAWLALREGFATRICRVMAWSIIIVALLALAEHRTGSPIWITRLPSFLKIDGELMSQMMSGNARAGTEINRVRGTFTGALYFGEYLAISLPFVLHFLARSKRFMDSALLLAGGLAVTTTIVFTDSRASMLGLLMTLLGYGFMVAWRLNRQRPESLAASAALFFYPVMALLMAALVVFWRRLHVMVIGGGQHASSTDTRAIQWEMGLPKIATHPFGHGVGRSGLELGYYNPGSDNPTVDSYYLTLMLDYGPLGLLVFLALFAVVIWLGFRGYTRARSEELQLMAPLTIVMANYVVIKFVASTEINLPVIMVLMGCLIGLIARQNRIDNPAPAVAAAAGADMSGTRSPALARA